MNNQKEEWIWVGHRLCCRPCNGTYITTNYHSLPQIDIDPKFAEIKTLKDIEHQQDVLNSTIMSPTGCYFNIDDDDNVFYRDQQDCVLWAYDEKTGYIYIYDDDEPDKRHYVAKSIAEFLTRIQLESEIWHYNLREYFGIFEMRDKHLKYIRHFFDESAV